MLKLNEFSCEMPGSSIYGTTLGVAEGMITGVVGESGSGKEALLFFSTEIPRILSGSITVFGKKLWQLSEIEKQKIALVSLSMSYYRRDQEPLKLSDELASTYIEFNEVIYRELLDSFGITDVLPIREMSDSSYALLLIAIALSREARLIILDSVTDVLDSSAKDAVFSVLKTHTEHGGSVIFSSHSLEDVGRLCDEVVVFKNGRAIIGASTDDIKDGYDIVDISERELSDIDPNCMISIRRNAYSVSALVYRGSVNRALVKRRATFREILEFLMQRRSSNETRK